MYIHRNSSKYRLEDGTLVSGKGKDFKDIYRSDEFGCSNGVSISETICYWRKANAIHGWFVSNVMGDEDECREFYVPMEKLKELYADCKSVLKVFEGKRMYLDPKLNDCDREGKDSEFAFSSKSKRKISDYWSYLVELTDKEKEEIKDILPPTEGFFFGTYELDGGYLYDILKTIKMLDRLFKQDKEAAKKGEHYDYEYYPSW